MYSTKILDKIEYTPHSWKGLRVGIFYVENGAEVQIGEYERNYPNFSNTFFPFQQNGKDFALYSPDYTITRIMELPSCIDIGGEGPNPNGFCPVDYYVPSYIDQEVTSREVNSEGKIKETIWTTRISEPKENDLTKHSKFYPYENVKTGEKGEAETVYSPLTSRLYYPFGFVYGCYWADDFTLHYLDLSEAEKGIIKREDRFKYVDLPSNLRLKDSIDMQYYLKGSGERANFIRMHVMQTVDLVSGKIIEPYG